MSSASVWTQMGVVILVVCLCSLDIVAVEGKPLSGRKKRGFRTNSSSRVAHGYGKRGSSFLSLASPDALPLADQQQEMEEALLPKLGFASLASIRPSADEGDGSLATVEEFTDLLINHPSLARAIVKKFVDVDRDDIITTAELFRSTARK